MLRSQAEIKELAKGILNGIFSELLAEFEKVDKAWMKSREADKLEFLERQEEMVEEILLKKFGSSD